jgi:hypothetical protein
MAFAKKVSFPLVYQPLVDVVKSRKGMQALVRRLQKNIRMSIDKEYRTAMQAKIDRLKLIIPLMKKLEDDL